MAPDPPGFFPPARCIPPLQPPHQQTFILLHGRGLSAHTFGPDLLSTAFSLSRGDTHSQDDNARSTQVAATTSSSSNNTTTLREAFPHAKIIVPLAPHHRATIYKRSIIHQWCDSWDPSSTFPSSSEEWRAVPGLRDTVSYLHSLIRAEAEALGGTKKTGNIVLGGLSQGCAAALVALLLWDGSAPLMGFWGMCGWLFFEGDVKAVLGLETGGNGAEGEGEEKFDPFEREEDEEPRGEGEAEMCVEARVVRALKERLELEEGHGRGVRSRPGSFDTPIFLGHGVEDGKVPGYPREGGCPVLANRRV